MVDGMTKKESLDAQYEYIINELEGRFSAYDFRYLNNLPVWENFKSRFSSTNMAKILELGCGPKTDFKTLDWVEYHGLELSSKAVLLANCDSIIHGNALYIDNYFQDKFDLIIDSHLLHNLPSQEDVKVVLKKSLCQLKEGGMLIGELPVANSHFKNTTSKIVHSSLEWENLFIEVTKEYDCYIGYFTMAWNLKMIVDDSGEDRDPLSSDPDVLRYILIKKVLT